MTLYECVKNSKNDKNEKYKERIKNNKVIKR